MDASIREEILSILDRANDMTLATVRQDGYPQATTVSYANDGLDIYFGCAADSQKAWNINRNRKVSLTVNLPYANWGEIRGISAGGLADCLTDPQEIARAGQLLLEKFPQGIAEYASGALEGVAFFKVVPKVISVLDYRKGFGHTDLVGNAPGLTPAWDHRG
ncbi:pyridoxamine 5'-phosphate oxidase family protein [Microvirga yunnanensis]|uniref:pyridoxamine 5'-phosphate oxidase family protein n=1 Tax=Microvirga yunnanensis TaxID=2953740 RepID=UPI0021C81E10|nr:MULTISPECIES: pyridoxamine 5'-phosphate oxidase family protein [unclassified Microvirga]